MRSVTDYLEELLEDQEQEDAAQGPEWKKTQIAVRGNLLPEISNEAVSPGNAQSTELVGQKMAVPPGEDPADVRGRTYADSGITAAAPSAQGISLSEQAEGLRSAAWSLEWQLRRLHRAVHPWEWRQGGHTGQAAPAGVSDGGSFRGSAPGLRSVGGYAALIDAVFARDARRYDGPLRLL